MADLKEIRGVVGQTNEGGFKFQNSEAWINYSKVGARYKGPTFREGEKAVVRCSESKGKWYASFGEYPNGGGPSPAPSPAPSPVPAEPAPGPAPDSYDGFRRQGQEEYQDGVVVEMDAGAPAGPSPEPGTFAYRDLVLEPRTRRSIERQVALKAAVDAVKVGPTWENDNNLRQAITDMAEHYIAWLEDRPPVDKQPEEPSP